MLNVIQDPAGADRAWSPLFGLAVAFALPFAIDREQAGFIMPRWLMTLGGISYSLYLMHGPAISVVGRAAEGAGWMTLLLLGVGASIAAGVVYYHIWERPFAEPKSTCAAPTLTICKAHSAATPGATS